MTHKKSVTAIMDHMIEGKENCPVCENRIGFSFGTCAECGFNAQRGEFTFIKVQTACLSEALRAKLTLAHAEKYIEHLHHCDLDDLRAVGKSTRVNPVFGRATMFATSTKKEIR